MGNNIFIGLRYTPIFTGEWVKEKSYERLMFVTHERNVYISLTDVPSGVDITNEQYWFLASDYTANYNKCNEMLETVRDEVSKLIDNFGGDEAINLTLYETIPYTDDCYCKVRRFGQVAVAEINVNLVRSDGVIIGRGGKEPFAVLPSNLQPCASFATTSPLLGGGHLNLTYYAGAFFVQPSDDVVNESIGEYDLSKMRARFLVPYIIK